MIHIQVIQARNLKFPDNRLKTTDISCFSRFNSDYYYFLGFCTNKKKEKTANPKWNWEFDLNLIHAYSILFKINFGNIFRINKFLGQVEIDFNQFLTHGEGKQLIKNPNQKFVFQFPISTQDATLDISFIYSELVLTPISVVDIPHPILHFWVTLDPKYENDELNNPIKIELITINVGLHNMNLKSGENICYSHFNEFVSWKPTKIESSIKNVFVGTEFTQMHSIQINCLDDVYDVIILDVSNYTGRATLHLIAEGNWKFNQSNKIGTIEQIDIHIENNKKYVVPFTLHSNFLADGKCDLEINSIPTNNLVFDKKNPYEDYLDQTLNETPFHSEIISMVKEVTPSLTNTNIVKSNILPETGQFSLQKIFRNAGLQSNDYKIRIYYDARGGRHPFCYVLDMTNKKRSQQIEKEIKKKTVSKKFLNDTFSSRSCMIELDLNQIGRDKIIYINDDNTLKKVHFINVAMTHMNGENETLLIQNRIAIKNICACFTVLLKIMFINDEWNLIPVNHDFYSKKEMSSAINKLLDDQYLIQPITI